MKQEFQSTLSHCGCAIRHKREDISADVPLEVHEGVEGEKMVAGGARLKYDHQSGRHPHWRDGRGCLVNCKEEERGEGVGEWEGGMGREGEGGGGVNLVHVCECHLTKTGWQNKVAESGDYLLASQWPLRAGKIEKHRGEGREEGEETAFL